MSPSPTARSLASLRAEGYLADVVEQSIPHARTKRDLFGFIDILAVRGGETLAVQTTDHTHVANRVAKIRDSLNLDAVRDAGWRIVVHGWRTNGTCRVVDLTERTS